MTNSNIGYAKHCFHKHCFHRLLVLSILSSLLLLPACSAFGSKKNNPYVEATVVAVAAGYLGQLSRGDFHQLNSSVSWPVYLEKNKKGLSKPAYASAVHLIQNRWPVAEHPLLGLEIVRVDLENNLATIIFRKANVSNPPEISVTLSWNGTAWLVVDDSLFGKGLLVEKWLTEAANASS